MVSQQQTPPFLFCEEQHLHWDAEETTSESHTIFKSETFPELLGQWDDEELGSLLKREKESEVVCSGSEENFPPSLGRARGEAVEWVLKVTGYYSFSALTAVLAVNYLDRFLCKFHYSHRGKPWMVHLAAVASISLAAKVDETEVPLLLDLQVEESKYVFESRTIQRMEILVLSKLKWRMNPVTPFDFLDYIARRLALKNNEILWRCERLILSVMSDRRYMSCLPSALATATVLYVITSTEPCCFGLNYHDHLVGILGIHKEKVDDCCVLIQEMAASVDLKRKYGALGCSPKGVFDASFTSDSSDDSWSVEPTSSVSSSPEPLSKKIKSQSPETLKFSKL